MGGKASVLLHDAGQVEQGCLDISAQGSSHWKTEPQKKAATIELSTLRNLEETVQYGNDLLSATCKPADDGSGIERDSLPLILIASALFVKRERTHRVEGLY